MTSGASLPDWLVEWCRDHLRSRPEQILFDARPASEVFGVRLHDGRDVLVKARPGDTGRASACVEIQKRAAAAGLPCAAPLTDATDRGGRTIHAEQWRPGGSVRHDDGRQHAGESAQLLATVMQALSAVSRPLRSLKPNPVWVRWEHSDGDWPRFDPVDEQQARTGIALPRWLEEVQQRIQRRLGRTGLPLVIGHADWEAQNLRWQGHTIHTIHDWDSLAVLPEAGVVGAAAGAFASTDIPTLAPLTSSETFLAAYQDAADRRFTEEEVEVAWAASVYPAAHNARGEVLFGNPSIAGEALRVQAEERLRRAGA